MAAAASSSAFMSSFCASSPFYLSIKIATAASDAFSKPAIFEHSSLAF